MTHPQNIQDAWDNLVPFPQPVPLSPDDLPTVDDLILAVGLAELTPAMRRIAGALTDAGFAVSVADGLLWVDVDVTTDPDTGVADGTTFRVEQVNG